MCKHFGAFKITVSGWTQLIVFTSKPFVILKSKSNKQEQVYCLFPFLNTAFIKKLKWGKTGLKKCINQKWSHSRSLSHRHFRASSQFQHIHVYNFKRKCISLHQETFFSFMFFYFSDDKFANNFLPYIGFVVLFCFLTPYFEVYLSSPLCSPCRSSLLLLAPLLADTDPLVSRPPGSAEDLHTRFHWIADHVPAFRVPGRCIRVLHSPDEFYQTIKVHVCVGMRACVWA